MTVDHSTAILANLEGGTRSLRGESVPTTGFMVGGIVSPLIYDAVCEPEDIQEFADYLSEHAGADYLGWWTDQETGLLWIDGSSWHEGLEAASAAGRDRDELAIYDIANGAEIRL